MDGPHTSFIAAVYRSDWKESMPPESLSEVMGYIQSLSSVNPDQRTASIKSSQAARGTVAGSGIFHLRYRIDETATSSNIPDEERRALENAPVPLCFVQLYANKNGDANNALHPQPTIHCTLVKMLR